MGSPGPRAALTASILAVLLVIAGGAEIIAPGGSTLLGLVLVALAFGLSGYARKARAAHMHRQKIAGMWQWAQGLGPRNKRGG